MDWGLGPCLFAESINRRCSVSVTPSLSGLHWGVIPGLFHQSWGISPSHRGGGPERGEISQHCFSTPEVPPLCKVLPCGAWGDLNPGCCRCCKVGALLHVNPFLPALQPVTLGVIGATRATQILPPAWLTPPCQQGFKGRWNSQHSSSWFRSPWWGPQKTTVGDRVHVLQ